MATTTRAECDTCNKVMSISHAVVFIVAGVTYVMCLDCTLSQLDDDDSVSVSVDLLRRLRDGILLLRTGAMSASRRKFLTDNTAQWGGPR